MVRQLKSISNLKEREFKSFCWKVEEALLILLLHAFPYLIVCDLLHAYEVQNLEKDAKVCPERAEVVSVVIEK